MKIDAVIGANYGDEGKGQMTDYLVHKALLEEDAVVGVVRFNGGAQAGHTVELEDGTKHVFSHFGSGSFQEVDTILSSHFVLNPVVFYNEWAELYEKLVIMPRVKAYRGSPITTPFEVLINRAIETRRGDERHGSVGVGFGETVQRDEDNVVFTPARCSPDDLKNVEDWFHKRLAFHGITLTLSELQSISKPKIDDYMSKLHFMLEMVEWYNTHGSVIKNYSHLVFEGAQGLLLDMDYGQFPHVTRSYTGLRNVVEIVGQKPMTVHYMTRSFMTRHGAGPLDNEVIKIGGEVIVDETNKHNNWQKSIRVAELDLHALKARCLNDRNLHNPNADIRYGVTWANSKEKRADLNILGNKVTFFNTKTRKSDQ